MNPDSLEESIQNILAALYPPFDATAPTVLTQLFQVIEGRYQGDALQCLLDFLIPAKHILESVQQAACAQFSEVVFCCEGWPLCLHDRVVIHLSPVNPLLLRPDDFYLQVAPFSQQAARILVSSLLQEGERLGREVEVEETPIPETLYPSIFTEAWLAELNQGRHGAPLTHCLLATDQGMVRVPWAQVALPEFVEDKPRGTMASSPSPSAMASAPPPPPPPPPLPLSTTTRQDLSLPLPGPSLTQPPSAYSVETRIRPAKHGIAVSLRLVDSASASSRLVKIDQDQYQTRDRARDHAKPIGWVSPHTWNNRCTSNSNNTSSRNLTHAAEAECSVSSSMKYSGSNPTTNTTTTGGTNTSNPPSTSISRPTSTNTSNPPSTSKPPSTSVSKPTSTNTSNPTSTSKPPSTSVSKPTSTNTSNPTSTSKPPSTSVSKPTSTNSSNPTSTSTPTSTSVSKPTSTNSSNPPSTSSSTSNPPSTSTSKPSGLNRAEAEGEYIDLVEALQLLSWAQTDRQTHPSLETMSRSNNRPAPPSPPAPPALHQLSSHCSPPAPHHHHHHGAPREPHSHCEHPVPHHHQPPRDPPSHCEHPAHHLHQPLRDPHPHCDPPSTHHSHGPPRDPTLHCGRMVRFSEDPCTPCLRRRMGKVSQTQELRESYQAALQNPVPFERERERENTLEAVEESGPRERERLGPEGAGSSSDPPQQCGPTGHHDQTPPVSIGSCRESGDIHTKSCDILQSLSITTEKGTGSGLFTTQQFCPPGGLDQSPLVSGVHTTSQGLLHSQCDVIEKSTRPGPGQGASRHRSFQKHEDQTPSDSTDPCIESGDMNTYMNTNMNTILRGPPRGRTSTETTERDGRCSGPFKQQRPPGHEDKTSPVRTTLSRDSGDINTQSCVPSHSHVKTIETPRHFRRETTETPQHNRREPTETAQHNRRETTETPQHNHRETTETAQHNRREPTETAQHNRRETTETAQHNRREPTETAQHNRREPTETAQHNRREPTETAQHNRRETTETAQHNCREPTETAQHNRREPTETAQHNRRETTETAQHNRRETTETAQHNRRETTETAQHNRRETTETAQHNHKETIERCSELSKHCGPLGQGDKSTPFRTTLSRDSGDSNTSSCGPHSHSCRETTETDRRCCSSLSTTVVETSEKCEVVVQGHNVRRGDITDSSLEMIPRLHVVKCKNATAFGLVSPKMSKRRLPSQDGGQAGKTPMLSRQGQQTQPQTRKQTDNQTPPLQTTKEPQPRSEALAVPDPTAHPLQMGIVWLTGGRDKAGRAVVEVHGVHQGWRSPQLSGQELCRLLLYLHSIIRKELRELGMTLVVDARRTPAPVQLNKALVMLQEQSPGAVHSVVMLVEKESSHCPEKCPGLQTDVVTSLKTLHKVVEGSQLTSDLDGTLPYCHTDWLQLHQKLHPFMSDLQEASGLLLRAIKRLGGHQRIDTVQDVQQCIKEQRTLMRDVLEDSRLVTLQREGGAMLARLRRESDLRYAHCEDYSDAVDAVTCQYNHVEEQGHTLVKQSNMSLDHLEYLLQLRHMEGLFTQIREWFDAEGERRLLEAQSVEDSRERVEQTLHSFTSFLIEAHDRQQQALSLVTEAEQVQGQSYPETEVFRTMVGTFKPGLADFLSRAERCCQELQTMVHICHFCEQVTELAQDCRQYLDQEQAHRASGAALLGYRDHVSTLHMYQESFSQFSPETFQQVKAQASALRGSRGMRVWNVAWLRCQEVRQQLEERLQEVVEAQLDTGLWAGHGGSVDRGSETSGPLSPHGGNMGRVPQQDTSPWSGHGGDFNDEAQSAQTAPPTGQDMLLTRPGPAHWENIPSGCPGSPEGRVYRTVESSKNSVACCHIDLKPGANRAGCKTRLKVTATPESHGRSTGREREESRREANSRAVRRKERRDAAALEDTHTAGCVWFPWQRGLVGRSVSEDSCATPTSGHHAEPLAEAQTPASCSHGQPSCRILQAAQRFQISRHGSFCSEKSCSGVEVLGDRGALAARHGPTVRRCEGTASLVSPEENTSNTVKLQRIMEELFLTEREYVRSLGYILTHYLPLLEKADVPQDLRGKRSLIFGNMEKLHDFHSHCFLPELEACQREPLLVAQCFLRHRESFGLYALYSRNKPQSDTLILHRRHDIFKRKQQELGDMMDLSSYLLRPIQRISKYSLLLQDLLGGCGGGSERDREKAEIQAAADVVRFQMRHGNDLLTMDAIQDCDVNLKEQGQLVRQDEFTVFFRKKRCVRRVFLFQNLILFSKTRKTDRGNDVYVYKQSFKMCDIGMTHNSGESGLCFEIWFRRRKSQDTYTLRADRAEGKKAWTRDLEQILWEQATYSRELHMQERVFMGVGRKPFMDIQPSESAICDRAVNCVLPGRGPVACCAQRDLGYPRPNSIDSGSSASTSCSQSSSSSGRGSLPPAGYPSNQPQRGEANHVACCSTEAMAEDDINSHLHHHHHHHHQKQKLQVLLDGTELSGESTSSAPSCLSAIGGEVEGSSSSSLASQSSNPCDTLLPAPGLRKTSPPATTRKRPSITPKPPGLATAQGLGKGKEVVAVGKTTDV